MKTKFYLIPLAALAAITFSLTYLTTNQKLFKSAFKNSHLVNTNGAPNKKTGAPGEGSCVDCHSGSVNDGSTINNLVMVEDGTTNIVSQYTPGQTYLLTLAINAASTKKGFQTVALKTSDNTQAGTMTAVSGSTATTTFQGRSYVNHITASTTAATFSFKWTAPATDVGDVKFYLATNATNNNSSTSGDLIYLSQHTFSAAAAVTPTASFTNTASTICSGATVSYTNTSTGNPTTISWSFPGGNPATSNSPNPVVTYASAGTYTSTLTVSNSAGTTTSNATINVQEVASLTLGTVNNTTACGASDGSVQITGTGTGTLSWTGSASGSMSNVTLPTTVNNLAAGTYTFSLDNGTTCTSNVVSGAVNDAGAPVAPTISSSDLDNIICSGTSLTLTSSSAIGNTWSTGETTQSITVTTAGDYFVTYTENACSSTSTLTAVSVITCASVSENVKDVIVVYPNPTNDNLTIKNIDFNNYSKISLFDLQGKTVKTWTITSEEENLSLNDIKNGSYLIKISGKKGTIVKPITKF